jgi:hypothetical protein
LADYTKHHVGEPWEQADLFFLPLSTPHARAFSVSSGFSTKGTASELACHVICATLRSQALLA